MHASLPLRGAALGLESGGVGRQGMAAPIVGYREGGVVSAKRVALLALAFALFFCPAIYAVPLSVFRGWQVATCVVGVIATLEYIRMNRIDGAWVAFSLFFVVYYFVSSLAADSDGWMVSIVYNSVKGIGFASLAYGSLRGNTRECVLGFAAGGLVMCAVNYGTFLVFRDSPSGMYAGGGLQNWYFLQHDNGTLFYYLPVAACLLHYGLAYGSKGAERLGYVFTALTVAMFLYLHSAAAMVVSALFALFLLYARRKDRGGRPWRFMSPFAATMAGLALCVLIVLIGYSSLVSDIVAALGKSYTFGIRLGIWDNAIGYFESSPIIGMGMGSVDTRVSMLTFDHPHNLVLQVLFQGGLVSLVLFVAMCLSGGPGKVFACAKATFSFHVLGVCTLLIFVAGAVDFYPDQLPQYFPMILAGYLARTSGATIRPLRRMAR